MPNSGRHRLRQLSKRHRRRNWKPTRLGENQRNLQIPQQQLQKKPVENWVRLSSNGWQSHRTRNQDVQCLCRTIPDHQRTLHKNQYLLQVLRNRIPPNQAMSRGSRLQNMFWMLQSGTHLPKLPSHTQKMHKLRQKPLHHGIQVPKKKREKKRKSSSRE